MASHIRINISRVNGIDDQIRTRIFIEFALLDSVTVYHNVAINTFRKRLNTFSYLTLITTITIILNVPINFQIEIYHTKKQSFKLI